MAHAAKIGNWIPRSTPESPARLPSGRAASRRRLRAMRPHGRLTRAFAKIGIQDRKAIGLLVPPVDPSVDPKQEKEIKPVDPSVDPKQVAKLDEACQMETN